MPQRAGDFKSPSAGAGQWTSVCLLGFRGQPGVIWSGIVGCPRGCRCPLVARIPSLDSGAMADGNPMDRIIEQTRQSQLREEAERLSAERAIQEEAYRAAGKKAFQDAWFSSLWDTLDQSSKAVAATLQSTGVPTEEIEFANWEFREVGRGKKKKTVQHRVVWGRAEGWDLGGWEYEYSVYERDYGSDTSYVTKSETHVSLLLDGQLTNSSSKEVGTFMLDSTIAPDPKNQEARECLKLLVGIIARHGLSWPKDAPDVSGFIKGPFASSWSDLTKPSQRRDADGLVQFVELIEPIDFWLA